MAVPYPAYNTNSISQRGYTKLFWGTEALGMNTATYIVISAKPAQVSEAILTQQGSGLTAVTTLLIDGARFELTVEEDINIIPPYVGQVVTFQNVFTNAATGNSNTIAPWGAGTIPTGPFQIESNDFNAARKEPGTRVIVGRSYALINAINGGGNPTTLNT